jgi:hypothetical protein
MQMSQAIRLLSLIMAIKLLLQIMSPGCTVKTNLVNVFEESESTARDI